MGRAAAGGPVMISSAGLASLKSHRAGVSALNGHTSHTRPSPSAPPVTHMKINKGLLGRTALQLLLQRWGEGAPEASSRPRCP